MRRLVAWTLVVWAAAWLGWLGVAVLLAGAALGDATRLAAGELRRRRSCWVCGRGYGVGQLGAHASCLEGARAWSARGGKTSR